MKLKPILFSTPMVEAILNGTKTQTRRIVKPQPENQHHWQTFDHYKQNSALLNTNNGLGVQFSHSIENNHEKDVFSKSKANVGDVFWVRETWQYNDDLQEPYLYKQKKLEELKPEYFKEIKWRPSIFMPKEACRLFLKVTNVRVERLQDISEEDAVKEGIRGVYNKQVKNHNDCWLDYLHGHRGFSSPTRSFYTLWESINGKESLESNPWVWVYEFKITETPLYL